MSSTEAMNEQVGSTVELHEVKKAGDLSVDIADQETTRSRSANPIRLQWGDISFKVQTDDGATKTILNGVSGQVGPGELLAILGASGAGKTTLLNVLANRLFQSSTSTLTGEITVNGVPRDPEVYKDHVAYVMQDDIMLPTMSPRELLEFSAKLRLPQSISDTEKKFRVSDIIKELGLSKCQDTLTGGGTSMITGVSGGERKRTSIGIELVTDPGLLFVDEPTSGLDSFTARAVVEKLSQMADRGRTVVTTIHQPSSDIFNLFDKLMLIASGNIVYLGPAKDAVKYFADLGFKCPEYTNPADFFMNVLNQDARDPEVLERFKEAYAESRKAHTAREASIQQQLHPLKSLEGQTASWSTQMKELSVRALKNYTRQPALTKFRTIQNVFLALITGLIYLQIGNTQKTIQDRNGVLFFIITNNVMTSVLSVVLTFPAERQMFEREVSNNMYSAFSYFVSKSISEAPFQIFYPLLYSVIIYWLIGLQDGVEHFALFFLTNFLVVNAGQSLGLLLGCAVPDPQAAVALTPLAIIPFMLFAGFFVNSENIPVYFVWLQWTSPFKYGFELVAINEYEDLHLDCKQDELIQVNNQIVCPFTRGEQVLANLDIDTDDVGRNLGLLIAVIVGFRVLAYILLEMQVRTKLRRVNA